jgi:hypothetical protein
MKLGWNSVFLPEVARHSTGRWLERIAAVSTDKGKIGLVQKQSKFL